MLVRKVLSRLAAAAIVMGVLLQAPVRADPAAVTVTAEQDLRFGTFAVPSAGWRSVSTAGAVAGSGILSFSGDPPGPARFTIVFDRGNESRRAIDVLLQVIIVAPQSVVQGGVTGTLSGLATDLGGAAGTLGSLTTTLTLANCRERRCSRSFNVGGRIDVARSGGGANLRIPLSATAIVVSVN